jgi:hypothetical protein
LITTSAICFSKTAAITTKTISKPINKAVIHFNIERLAGFFCLLLLDLFLGDLDITFLYFDTIKDSSISAYQS